jgi:G protein beta subunit-like protein
MPDVPEMSVILCTAGYDHSIRFWEAWSGICHRQIALNQAWVRVLCCHGQCRAPETTLLSCSCGLTSIELQLTHQRQVNRIAISPDKNFVAAATHTSVRIWDIPSGSATPVASLEGHSGNVTALAYGAQGKWLVTGSEDHTVRVWDTRTASVQRRYEHEAPVNDVVIHPNQGELISCDQAGSVKIWDLGENTCTHELVPDEDVAIRSVTIASDGATLVAGNDLGMCYVWKIQGPQLLPVTSFQAHPKYVTRVLLSPDTKYVDPINQLLRRIPPQTSES